MEVSEAARRSEPGRSPAIRTATRAGTSRDAIDNKSSFVLFHWFFDANRNRR